ncbi:MAG: NAD(P)/FAD-dependent oxidoreductase [Oscillospiraceae bacterium]
MTEGVTYMDTSFDIIIIGTGPAGVSAALYTQRAGMKTLLVGSKSLSLEKAEKIENYYGVAGGVSGTQLFETGVSQARAVGAQILEGQVVGISWDGTYTVKTTQEQLTANAVIIATGTKRDTPRIEGLKEMEGLGVSYCAVCDGFFYKGKKVAVLGGGDYAIEEATHLKAIAQSVVILTDGVLPKERQQDFEYIDKKIKKIRGTQKVEGVVFGDDTELEISGLFVAVGTAGATDLAKKLGVETNGSYIAVDENMQTNLPGLYAAGDTTGGLLQVAKAVYQGAMAGTQSVKFVRGIKK